MKKFIITSALLTGVVAMAQDTNGKVGINTQTPSATLEITPNATNANGTTNEGLLIPKLNKTRVTSIATDKRVEGTLVYVTDDVLDTDNATFTGTGKGFYYYDANAQRWIKQSDAKTSAPASGASLSALTGTIYKAASITVEEWTTRGVFAFVQTGPDTIKLPNPANYKNKIIAVNNNAGEALNYAGTYSPAHNSTLYAGKGHLLMSDGNAWYVIGGSY